MKIFEVIGNSQINMMKQDVIAILAAPPKNAQIIHTDTNKVFIPSSIGLFK